MDNGVFNILKNEKKVTLLTNYKDLKEPGEHDNAPLI